MKPGQATEMVSVVIYNKVLQKDRYTNHISIFVSSISKKNTRFVWLS